MKRKIRLSETLKVNEKVQSLGNSERIYAVEKWLKPIAAILLVGAISFNASNLSAQTITEGMQKQLPQVIEFLNSKKLKNVGVLKFLVRKHGQKDVSDSVGPLNSLLADRLELGLILANPFEESQQLNIIEGASDQVAKLEGANHRDDEGRRKLFAHQYTLAWGETSVVPDAFITGGVAINSDNVSAKVVLLYVTKDGETAQQIGEQFTAQLDAQSLSEVGESFNLRGIFDHGETTTSFENAQKQKQEFIREEIVKVRTEQSSFPLNDPAAPMRLDIRYDGQSVPIELRNGNAFVQEPKQGQNVELVLIRNPSAKGRLGAVLKVNGENTLYRSTVRDLDAPKWIIGSESQQTVIKGYQIDNERREKFLILSDAESKSRAMDYGRYVGQIQLTVFPELENAAPARQTIDEAQEDLVAMFRGIHPKIQPKNLGALKHQIRQTGQSGRKTRGLIVGGSSETSKVQRVRFQPDPTPLMSVTITYYK